MRAVRGVCSGMLLALAAVLPAAAADADAATMPVSGPHFTGHWQQGGVLVGRVAPGSALRFGGRAVGVAPDGHFVLGLAYDAAPAAELHVTDPSGAVHRHEYSVQPRVYDVQKIGGLPKAMVEPPATVLERIAGDARQVTAAREFDTPIGDFAGDFIWPVTAQVTGVYGSSRILNGVPRQPHFGIDLAAPEGAPVRAAAGGVVRMAQRDLYYTGGTIILDHGHGLNTTYLHLSKLAVKEGQEVKRGAVIGNVGKTGRATGPHLCWRANWFDVRVDPSLLLQSEPAKKGEKKR